jgi:hypothetical protein
LGVADEIFAPDHSYHDPASPMIGPGPEGQKQLIGMYIPAYPDLHHAVEDQIAEGDTVVTRWTGTGTHQGDLLGMAPTGKEAKVMGIWNVWDTLGMLQQLGDHSYAGASRELALALCVGDLSCAAWITNDC